MPEWESECMSYKDLKKQLNLMDPERRHEGFQQLLKNELERMNDFFVRTEEEYIIRFQVVKSYTSYPLNYFIGFMVRKFIFFVLLYWK